MTDENTPNDDESKPVFQRDPKRLLRTVVANKYLTVEYLGGGGFGEVYKARNVQMEEQVVVIKFLKQVDARNRFLNEARLLCQLDHPSICRMIDYLPVEGALVMQYIDGKDGEQLMRDPDNVRSDVLLKIARAIAAALAYAHKRNIAHRDVKPKNIMVDHNGHVYLIDFGIAKALDATGLTGTGRPPYTPQYAAPERHRVQAYNPYLSDIYEIGATILELATGRTPLEEFFGRKSSKSGGVKRRSLSRQLRRVLKKATQNQPSDRYASADALHRDFSRVKHAFRRSRGWTFAAGFLVAAVVVLTGYNWRYDLNDIYQSVFRTKNSNANETFPNAASSTTPEVASLADDTILMAEPEDTYHDSISDSVEAGPIMKPEPRSTVEKVRLVSLQVDVIPIQNALLYIDNVVQSSGRAIEIIPGSHEVRVIHPDYPVYVDTVSVAAGRTVLCNLETEFANREELTLAIGSSQILVDACLKLELNGRNIRRCKIPFSDLKIRRGTWDVSFSLTGQNGATRQLDSVVTFPYGNGPRVNLGVSGRTINFDEVEWLGKRRIDIVLYWSE